MTKQFKEWLECLIVILICCFGLNLILIHKFMSLALALSSYESIVFALLMFFAPWMTRNENLLTFKTKSDTL